MNTQNNEIIEIFEPSDLKLGSIEGGLKCPTRKLTRLVDILLKPNIKSLTCDDMDFLI